MWAATGEAWQKNIRRAAPSLMRVVHVWDQQVERLDLRGHAGAIAEMGEYVAQGMVPPRAVPATVAKQCMVALGVHHGAAERAVHARRQHVHAQTAPELYNELVRPHRKAKLRRWDRRKEIPSPRRRL